MQKQRGFTLIEFVLVLLIGSILWGLSLRGLHQLNHFKTSLQYEEIVQLLNLGHKIAKVSNQPVTIFCSNNHIYLSEKFQHFALQENATDVAVSQQAKLRCASEITFWPNGLVIADNMTAKRFEWSIAEYKIYIDGRTSYVYE